MPGADKVVARRLAGRIGRVRGVGGRLLEGRILRSERSVNLIGGNVVETEIRRCVTRGNESAGRFEQAESPGDIGVQECLGGVDRAIDVAFRRKMREHRNTMLVEKPADQFPVPDVPVDKNECLIILREAGAVPGIGERVEHNNPVPGMGVPPMVNKIGSDKSRSAGDQKIHRAVICITGSGLGTRKMPEYFALASSVAARKERPCRFFIPQSR